MEKVQKQAMAILSIIGSIISFYKAIPYQKNVTFN
jgi:hypothetical protein